LGLVYFVLANFTPLSKFMNVERLKDLVYGVFNTPNDFALLLSNGGGHNYPIDKDFLLGIADGKESSVQILPSFGCWQFGFVGYGYHEQSRNASSPVHPDFFSINTTCHFFNASTVYPTFEEAYQVFGRHDSVSSFSRKAISVTALENKEEFIGKVSEIKAHLKKGDIYEINYCIPFYASYENYDWTDFFIRLNSRSLAPFSVFSRLGDLLIISASPERFFKKENNKVWVEPMKGTAPRFKDKFKDLNELNRLSFSEKERAENSMIVDLTRNDLAQFCKLGSVEVENLCRVYSFSHVHQMVSTVSGILQREMNLAEILSHIFPMGSMTGAPKIKAMELIAAFEKFSRGPFSGSFGYIAPNQDMDFNVLIRTVFVDAKRKKLFFALGSAITVKSNAEEEWAEVLLKGELIQQILNEPS